MNDAIAERTHINEQVSRLLRLKSTNSRQAIASSDNVVATAYIAELFKGNGWTVAFHEGGRQRAILLSEPRQPDTVLLIVKCMVCAKELSYEQVKQELMDFENNIGPSYGCSQFCLIAPNGYEAKTEKLQDFNLLLQEWDSVEELIHHYSKDNIREPRIQLFAHNKQTYYKVRKMMDRATGVAVVQATGTGKSYLIARLLQDFTGEKRLVMAPSYYIIDQIREHIRWETGMQADSIEYMTYARSMNLTAAEINRLTPKMIVLDEFHRCGAEEWGRGVQNILNAYPQAFKFGTSATPIRYLDNGRDMSKELFQGHVAENLSLAQAIVRNILPMPKYVCALYTLSEEINTMRTKIAGSRKSEESKRKLLLELDAFHIDWERSRGIPHVLKKHLRKSMRKFIIFCKDEAHLNEMEPIVKKWFKEAMDDIPVKTYRVYNNEMQSDEYLEEFKGDTSKDHLHLLFSINMLNEGLHVNEVNGVVLLRPTESPNIFYQQIGRCMKVGMHERPVIFDFVNNFKAIRTHDFLYDLEFAKKDLFNRRSEDGLEERCPKFDVNDEVREITEVFGEITFKLDSWNEMYDRLVKFHKRFGHSNVQAESDHELYRWLYHQRKRFQYGKLEEEQLEKLNALKVEWEIDTADALWDKNFIGLKEFKKKHGHFVIPFDKQYDVLRGWATKQRTALRKNELEKSRFDRLQKIGFIFDPIDEAWEKQFNDLKAFKNKFGHCTVPNNEDKYNQLHKWATRQRENLRKGKLEKDRVRRLEEIGFDFAPKDLDGDWQKRFDELVVYKKQNGHLQVTARENKTLNIWILRQRARRKKGLIPEERIIKLDSIGFAWELGNSKLFEKKFIAMQKFKQEHGHLRFSIKHPLTSWQTHLRTLHKEGKLTEEQQTRLKVLGFDYVFKENHSLRREKRIKELELFYKKYGHVHVTTEYEDFPGLAEWVLGIRKQKRNGVLPAKLIAYFNSMGMKWGRSVT